MKGEDDRLNRRTLTLRALAAARTSSTGTCPVTTTGAIDESVVQR